MSVDRDRPVSGGPGIVALLIALVSGLAGGFVGGLLSAHPAAPTEPAAASLGSNSSNSEDRLSRDALVALAQQIEGLRTDLARQPPLQAVPLPLASVASDSTTEGSAALAEQLAGMVVAQLRGQGEAGIAPGVAVLSERAPLVAVEATPSLSPEERLAALEQVHAKLQGGDESAAVREYLLWTQRQVVDRFGKPSEIWTGDNGDQRWNYELSGDRSVTLVFLDGLVVKGW